MPSQVFMDLVEVEEGDVKILVPAASLKDPSAGEVFYNVNMEPSRDIAVCCLRAYRKLRGGELAIAEPLAASGVRGIRYAREVEGVREVLLGDVSPQAVELARRNLELNGLIEVRQGATGGAFVRELDSKIIRQNLSDLLFFRKISVTQLYEVRMYVEPEVARLAALRRTEEDLQLLEHLVYLSETGEPGIDYIKHNVDFHRVLGKASQNPFYAVIINSIMDFTENFILTIKPVKEVIHERTIHREIYEAI